MAEKRDGLLTGRRWSIDGHGQVGSSNWGDRPAVDLAPCADGKSVSRRHAQLSWAPGQGWLLEDTGTDGRGSTYGTCHNGRRLQPRRPVLVQPGDTLSFGWVLLAVLADEEV